MKKYWISFMILMGSLGVGMGKAEENMFTSSDKNISVSYMMQFNFNNMHCAININDLLFTISTSILQSDWSPTRIMYSDEIGPYLQEGDNKLELIAVQLPKQMTDGTSPYCELIVTATATNWETGERESREVTHLRATINKDNQFTTEESREYPLPSVTDSIQMVELDDKEIDLEEVNNNVSLVRSLRVNHPHRAFAWNQAKPFEETPENMARLWQAYDELIDALSRQDAQKVEALLLPAAKERDVYTGYSGAGSRRLTEMMVFIKSNWRLYGFDFVFTENAKSRFVLQKANHGKLFRLNLGYMHNVSPLRYKAEDSNRVYNFYFTEIDGKIRVGVL